MVKRLGIGIIVVIFVGIVALLLIYNEDLPEGVTFYKVLPPSPEYTTTLPGALALVADRERKVHVHQVGTVWPSRPSVSPGV